MIAFLSIAVCAYLGISSQKNNKEGKKARKRMKATIIIVFLSSIAVSLLFVIMHYCQKRENYKELMEEGTRKYESGKYIEASEIFQQAYDIAYDADSEVGALTKKENCYLLCGFFENNDYYFKQALVLCENMIESEKYIETKEISCAYIDSCILYYELNYDWSTEKWQLAAKQVEKLLEQTGDITANDAPVMISAATSLSCYYKAMLLDEGATFWLDKNKWGKLLYYLGFSIDLKTHYIDYIGVDVYGMPRLYSAYDFASYMLNAALLYRNEDDISTRIEQIKIARKMCEEALGLLNAQGDTDIELQFLLEQTIGKSYLFESSFYNGYTRLEYKNKAYQIFMNLFQWGNEEIIDKIFITAAYLITTKCCTEDDICMILDKISSALYIYNKSDNLDRKIELELNGLLVCSYILNFCEYENCKTKSQALGKWLYDDLNGSMLWLLDNTEKETLLSYSKSFA